MDQALTICNMDVQFDTMLRANTLNYKRALARIVDKYSKIQYQDGEIEVDLNNTNNRTLEHYIRRSETEPNKLESKSPTDLRDETLSAQDITRDSQLDLTPQDSESDETCVSNVSSAQMSMEDGGMARSDMAELTMSLLDENQPEDQDEELEMLLRRNGSSWVKLHPSMIRAWHQQHVSEAADSVPRRYCRRRQQPNRSVNNRKHSMFQRFSTKQHSADTDQGHSASAAEFSGLCKSPLLNVL